MILEASKAEADQKFDMALLRAEIWRQRAFARYDFLQMETTRRDVEAQQQVQ